jgi:hypothetical protein
MVTLETQRASLVQQADDLRGLVEQERERLRGVRADATESRAAFKDWQAGLSKDPTARHRLGVILRRMLKALVLTSEASRGHRHSKDNRRLEVVFRDGDSEVFVISPDLTEAYFADGGERIV